MLPLPPEKIDLKFCHPLRPMIEGLATCPVPSCDLSLKNRSLPLWSTA